MYPKHPVFGCENSNPSPYRCAGGEVWCDKPDHKSSSVIADIANFIIYGNSSLIVSSLPIKIIIANWL